MRQVVEHSVIAAHRHVFGVLAWFSVLAALGLGPVGAVIYRLSRVRAALLGAREMRPVSDRSVKLRSRWRGNLWHLLDWLPARITAMGFAVTGSFEDAIDSWRNYERGGPVSNDGVILASTAGAINLRLGPVSEAYVPDMGGTGDGSATAGRAATGVGMGIEPEVGHLRVVVGPGLAHRRHVDGIAGAVEPCAPAGLSAFLSRRPRAPSCRWGPRPFYSVARLRQLRKQFAVDPVAIRVDRVFAVRGLRRRDDGAAWLVQMGAVVEAAMIGMRGQVWHVAGQSHRVDVAQAELLETGRVDQRRCPAVVDPVPGGAGRRVLCRPAAPATIRRSECPARERSVLIRVLLPAPDGPSTRLVLCARRSCKVLRALSSAVLSETGSTW